MLTWDLRLVHIDVFMVIAYRGRTRERRRLRRDDAYDLQVIPRQSSKVPFNAAGILDVVIRIVHKTHQCLAIWMRFISRSINNEFF